MYRVVVLVGLAGCYSPSYSNCTIACTDSCPNSLTCDTQVHMCRAAGTTCSPGGDAGGDATGGTDAVVHMDAMRDAPADAAGGCTLRQEVPGTSQGPNLTVDLSANPIPAGDFVVMSVAAHGAGSSYTVSDLNGHQLDQAIKAQTTTSGVWMTSAIHYFLAAPSQISTVNVNFNANVVQMVVIGDWQCGVSPSALSRTAMASGPSAGSTTDAGPMTPAARSLVVGSLAYPYNAGLAITTQGLVLLDGGGYSGPEGDINTLTGWGVFAPGTTIDATFQTAPGGPFAVTAAAFTVP